jgi:hypothetical protein
MVDLVISKNVRDWSTRFCSPEATAYHQPQLQPDPEPQSQKSFSLTPLEDIFRQVQEFVYRLSVNSSNAYQRELLRRLRS